RCAIVTTRRPARAKIKPSCDSSWVTSAKHSPTAAINSKRPPRPNCGAAVRRGRVAIGCKGGQPTRPICGTDSWHEPPQRGGSTLLSAIEVRLLHLPRLSGLDGHRSIEPRPQEQIRVFDLGPDFRLAADGVDLRTDEHHFAGELRFAAAGHRDIQRYAA